MKQTEKRFAFAGKRIAALPEAAISQQGWMCTEALLSCCTMAEVVMCCT